MTVGGKSEPLDHISTPAVIETDEDEVESSVVEEECANEQSRPGGIKYSREYLRKKYEARINLSRRGGKNKVVEDKEFSSSAVNTKVTVINQKLTKGLYRMKDRKDIQTREQVLDPRTEYFIYQLLNNGIFEQINGCISTGKEANVYHAINAEKENLAVKIYKTTVLSFKDRERYVNGEFRWKHGYTGSNPKKMITLWAEKEFRNLKRMEAAEIPCPGARVLRENVLVMDHIGKNGKAAPRLKDTKLSPRRLRDVYVQMMVNMRVMYQECKLVHGDLSEYNVLYQDKVLYFIDVSQSVEYDHPNSMEFLRMDCKNVNDYFKRQGVSVCTDIELFEFVVDPKIRRKRVGKRIEQLAKVVEDRVKNQTKVCNTEVQTRLDSYMRTSLYELDEEDMFSTNLAKARNLTVQRLTKFGEENEGEEEEESSSSEEVDLYSDIEDEPDPKDKITIEIVNKTKRRDMINHSLQGVDLSTVRNLKKRLTKEQLKEVLKANKKLVKLENRERRKTKMPKKEKRTRINRIKKKQGKK